MSAFDTAAPVYDAGFTSGAVARHLRGFVWEHLEASFRPGDRVLDLGCGTGEDARHMARRGVRVHAVDASGAMLDVARGKLDATNSAGGVTFAQANLAAFSPEHIPPDFEGRLDGAYSNFGVLNCLEIRAGLAHQLGTCVRPGGRLVLVVMGPLCPWEWLWYLPRGRIRTAFRRLRSGLPARVGDGSMPVWYPSPRSLRKEFAPWFRQVGLTGLGVCLPPSFAFSTVERRPDLIARLARWDRLLGARFPGTWLNDHYVLTLKRIRD
jgi:SAM-dependent methyltransferase